MKQDEVYKNLEYFAKAELEILTNLRIDQIQGYQTNSDQDSVKNVNKCVICLDKSVSIALQPCGHLCICQNCVKKMQNECPICRSAFQSTLRIFFP